MIEKKYSLKLYGILYLILAGIHIVTYDYWLYLVITLPVYGYMIIEGIILMTRDVSLKKFFVLFSINYIVLSLCVLEFAYLPRLFPELLVYGFFGTYRGFFELAAISRLWVWYIAPTFLIIFYFAVKNYDEENRGIMSLVSVIGVILSIVLSIIAFKRHLKYGCGYNILCFVNVIGCLAFMNTFSSITMRKIFRFIIENLSFWKVYIIILAVLFAMLIYINITDPDNSSSDDYYNQKKQHQKNKSFGDFYDAYEDAKSRYTD